MILKGQFNQNDKSIIILSFSLSNSHTHTTILKKVNGGFFLSPVKLFI